MIKRIVQTICPFVNWIVGLVGFNLFIYCSLHFVDVHCLLIPIRYIAGKNVFLSCGLSFHSDVSSVKVFNLIQSHLSVLGFIFWDIEIYLQIMFVQ